MRKLNVDLHIHTTCSDGELSVEKVLEEAKRLGLKFVGIVDHDTTKQFGEVKRCALLGELENSGTRVWVGTEFSCRLGENKMHILGYNFDPEHPKIKSLLKTMREYRKANALRKINRVREQGLPISKEQEEEILKLENPGKPHIVKALIENGVEGDVGSLIRSYLKDLPNLLKVDVKNVIEAVHEAGGKVVMAHPFQIEEENHLSRAQAVRVWEELAKLGIDGMECFYSQYDMKKIKQLVDFANKHSLLITMGSDFHGEHVKHNIKIGQVFVASR